jgi:DNA polymerase/3'-5' exonuclease PolX
LYIFVFSDLLKMPYRAYRNAARTVRGLGPELRDMVAQKDNLTQLPGIGKELAAKIVEILETGTARALEKLQANYPQTLRNLLKIPGLGPKRVGILFQDLGIHSMAQLIEAARTGKISSLSGFGTRTERQILQTAESFVQKKRRFKIAEVKPHDRLSGDSTRDQSSDRRWKLPACKRNGWRSRYSGNRPQGQSGDGPVCQI